MLRKLASIKNTRIIIYHSKQLFFPIYQCKQVQPPFLKHFSTEVQTPENKKTLFERINLYVNRNLKKSSNEKKISTEETSADFKRLLNLAKPEWKLISASMVALLIGSTSDLVLPAAIGKLIDLITNPAASTGYFNFTSISVALAATFVVSSVASFARMSWMTIAAERIMNNLRKNLFSTLVSQDIGFFDKTKTGELVNRLSSDSSMIARSMTANIATGIRAIIQLLGGIGILFYLSPKLTFVMLLMVPPVSVVGVIYGRYVKSYSRKSQDELAASTDVASERFGNITTVRSFNQEKREIDLYSGRINNVFEIGKKVGIVSAAFFSGIHLLGNLSLLGVLSYGGHLVLSGQVSVGNLSSFIFYSVYVMFGMMSVSSFYSDIMKALGSSVRVFNLLDMKPNVKSDKFRGDIEFKDIGFSYPVRNHVVVLKSVSFKVPAGSSLAVVGPSGSGKSTIAYLLLRFYEPQTGVITIDGQDLSQVDSTWWRDQIGFVSQDVVLFSGTIEDNISYGKVGATFQEISEAAKQANAHDFISSFPEGYKTAVGERGVTLSSGQIQRIGIARAILRNPKVLILDEATSALDAESEHLVKQAVDRLMEGRTVIVIAHRLSTIKSANRIVVIHKGTISESGTYEELMKNNGIFRQFVEIQQMR